MALDYQTALSEYGAVATFAQGNADVNKVLQDAIAGEWDAARFERALWGTNWYKSLSDNQRQIQVQQATDPATWQTNLTNKAHDVANMAAQLGVNVDAGSIAQAALWGNWDSTFLQQYLVQSGTVAKDVNGSAQGQAGDTQNHIRSTAAAYGVPMSQALLDEWSRGVAAGVNTTGGIDNQIIGMASRLFPMYAQDFTEGRTLSQVAQPFMQQMANTLEIDPSHINVNDATIMKALQGDGTAPMALYQFQQALKADPRWQKTDNAKNAAYDMVAQIGKDWGFK